LCIISITQCSRVEHYPKSSNAQGLSISQQLASFLCHNVKKLHEQRVRRIRLPILDADSTQTDVAKPIDAMLPSMLPNHRLMLPFRPRMLPIYMPAWQHVAGPLNTPSAFFVIYLSFSL